MHRCHVNQGTCSPRGRSGSISFGTNARMTAHISRICYQKQLPADWLLLTFVGTPLQRFLDTTQLSSSKHSRHTHTDVYIYVCIYLSDCPSIHPSKHTQTCTCHVHASLLAFLPYVHPPTYLPTCTHACVEACTFGYRHRHKQTNHVPTHTHTHT